MAEYIKKAPPRTARDLSAVEETARRMLADIKANGDAAVARYAADLDKWQGGEFRVSQDQIAAAEASLPET
ncbi:MAG: histidinol dehydrogenase, partial [Alphaproteobacteria bacterium]|nr:histidinol dehydrogenase [Alphaproteobacteria bacterium]